MKSLKAALLRLKKTGKINMPADFRKALAAAPKALALWSDITPIARQNWILWIISAKQTETRKRRIKNACSMLSSGKKRVCCFPGVNWLMKEYSR